MHWVVPAPALGVAGGLDEVVPVFHVEKVNRAREVTEVTLVPTSTVSLLHNSAPDGFPECFVGEVCGSQTKSLRSKSRVLTADTRLSLDSEGHSCLGDTPAFVLCWWCPVPVVEVTATAQRCPCFTP